MERPDVRELVTYDRAKRLIDISVASVGLVVSAPVLAVVALAVRRDVGSPVLFRQERPGMNGTPFSLVKFRTMREAGGPTDVAHDAARLTPLGRRLRASSLDELPTLWNVLRGDMSLVGPRPLLMQYLGRYTTEQAHRHDVRPGVTGLAQTSGRNALSWEEKFAFDVDYVNARSLRLDLRILARTASTVLGRRGTSASADVPMPEFLPRATQLSKTSSA